MTARMYLPWVRSGIAGAISAVDPLSGPVAAQGELSVGFTVNAGRAGSVPIRMYGPGAVRGFDPVQQVLRREPAPDSSDAEPNYFTTVEFRRPDMPWLFTPAAPNDDRLRPWIVLVVLRRDRVSMDTGAGSLPMLSVVDADQELPDLTESWAWAHAQVGTVADLSSGNGSQTLSRLVCPRLLQPGTRYLAAVVPAFESGRQAGLGLPVNDAAATTAPAWLPSTTNVDLPAYLWWEFVTGQEGDFEALVTRLRRVSLEGAITAGRPFRVADLPAGLPDLGTWHLPGALGGVPDAMPSAAFTDRLQALCNGAVAPQLVLSPPLYGRWHAAVSTVDANSPAWLRRLNLDPRYRAVAALGTRIVQEHQEDLMAAAWRQVGEIEAANRLLRQGQLARGAGQVLHAQLAGLAAVTLLQVTSALHGRVRADGTTASGATVAATIADSRVPAAMVTAAFRRATRPRGRFGRRLNTTGAAVLTAVNDGRLSVVRTPPRPAGLVTVDDAVGPKHTRLCQLTPNRLAVAKDQRHGGASQAQWDALLEAAFAHQRALPGCEPPTPRPRPALDLSGLRTVLLDATNPARTVPKRIRARVSLPAGWNPVDPLEPVWAAPRFDTPVYRDLVALAQDHVLPGVADVPANAVSALVTNSRFVEALMVGANHEMSRELLWRGFPTDQRGTYFRRFWNRTGAIGGPVDDITAIDGWTGDLGSHLRGGEQVVLLVRGEVLHRYPKTVVYAVRARWENGQRVPVVPTAAADPGASAFPERYPVFGGSIPPDITFLGFALDPDDARGDPDPANADAGWFFVFQQPPTEPRLGLDAPSPGTETQLSWSTVAKTASGYVDLAGGLTGVTEPGWGVESTSAAIAALAEQRPFRICIHASDLLAVPNP